MLDRKSLLIVAAVAAILLALVLVSYTAMYRKDHRDTCALHLLRIGQAIHSGSPRTASSWDQIGTGSAFFRDVSQWPVQTSFPVTPDLFRCPVRGGDGPDRIDYRGPVRNLHKMDPEDPIVADRPGNHGPSEGGNVLTRGGEILPCGIKDALWVRAAETTSAD